MVCGCSDCSLKNAICRGEKCISWTTYLLVIGVLVVIAAFVIYSGVDSPIKAFLKDIISYSSHALWVLFSGLAGFFGSEPNPGITNSSVQVDVSKAY